MSLFSLFSVSSLSDKLKNTASKFSSSLGQILTHRKLDEKSLEELEDLFIANDFGVEVAAQIVTDLRRQKFSKINSSAISSEEIRNFLAEEITKILKKCEGKAIIENAHKPTVITFNGVNGAGKTTTIGKIACNLKGQGKKVLIAACDTFRAAAKEQVEIWAQRANCDIILPLREGEDPASVAYRAVETGLKNSYDYVLIDTAGRLQNKQNLMDELKKINSVIKKLISSAPHLALLVIDATTGQNAKSQVEAFTLAVGINGLVITKLDGSSKGGIVVSLAKNFSLPIFAIGVGEKISDLQEFESASFAKNLVEV
jgi:fused signal recognition particle receptor